MREMKNKLYNFSEMEQMVREATCNEASIPSMMLLKEIAKGTFTVDFSSIMALIWKRERRPPRPPRQLPPHPHHTHRHQA